MRYVNVVYDWDDRTGQERLNSELDIELISDLIPGAAKVPQHLQTLYSTWGEK